jgi:hypothetical protein
MRSIETSLVLRMRDMFVASAQDGGLGVVQGSTHGGFPPVLLVMRCCASGWPLPVEDPRLMSACRA